MSRVSQTTVPGNINNVVLQNLDPDTPYNIKVTAIYPDGPGGELEGDGRTGMNYLCYFEPRLFKDVNWAHWQTRIRAIMPYSTNAHAV